MSGSESKGGLYVAKEVGNRRRTDVEVGIGGGEKATCGGGCWDLKPAQRARTPPPGVRDSGQTEAVTTGQREACAASSYATTCRVCALGEA